MQHEMLPPLLETASAIGQELSNSRLAAA